MKKVTLRLDEEMHAHIVDIAKREHRSLHSFILAALAERYEVTIKPPKVSRQPVVTSDLRQDVTPMFKPTKRRRAKA